jgi:PAT family beta-lactamase induction signal transducer AmpG
LPSLPNLLGRRRDWPISSSRLTAFRNIFGVYGSRRMAALVGLGFASGLPYVTVNDTLTAWLSALKVDVKAIGLFALVGLPYTFKFLWAPLLDRYSLPLLGRRRGWLVITQGLLVVSLALMAVAGPANSGGTLVGLAVLGTIMVVLSASQDIVADAYRTDVLEPRELGAGAAAFVSGYRVATIVAGALALVLADHIGWNAAIGLLAILMAGAVVVTILAPEPLHVTSPQSLGEAVVQPAAQFVARWGWAAVIIIVFVVVFRLPDQLASRMTMPLLLQQLKFTASEVGWIRQALGFFITIIGALCGGAVVARMGLIKSLILFGVLQAISNGGFLILAATSPTLWLMGVVIGVENFCNGLVAAGFVAFLMSCCDPRYSATQYALFTSLMALAAAVAGAITGLLVDRVGYVAFFAISIAAGIPGMALLFILPRPQALPQLPCPTCGHELLGNHGGTCPECGIVVPVELLAEIHRRASR